MGKSLLQHGPSALLYEQLLRAVQLLLDDPEARAQLQRRESRPRGEESLDLGPEARVQPEHQGELEGGYHGWVHGDVPHVVAGLAVLHAEVEEGPAQPAGLAAGQAQQLRPHLRQELGRHEEPGAALGTQRGSAQRGLDQVHQVGAQQLVLGVVQQVQVRQGGPLGELGICGGDKQPGQTGVSQLWGHTEPGAFGGGGGGGGVIPGTAPLPPSGTLSHLPAPQRDAGPLSDVPPPGGLPPPSWGTPAHLPPSRRRCPTTRSRRSPAGPALRPPAAPTAPASRLRLRRPLCPAGRRSATL